MIGESIDFFELEEFRVDLDKINQFIHEIKSLNYLEYNHVESHQEYQVGIKSTEKLEKLAEEIRNNPLPKDWTSWDESTKTDGVLVVVTDNLEKRTILHESGVWRGFASNVKEPEKKTQTSDTTENSTTEKEKPPITSTAKKPPINYPQKWRIQVVILLIIAATITTLIFLSIQYLVEPQQMLQPQIQKQQILQPQPQPTKTPQNQSPQKKTLETPAQKVIKPQPI
ncbi:hypothetical protein [Calothrix sp. PCC 6303]|uniref:hypothetical protein n=1 Tax=Calothrix sp. PCC 6303 TaxID=1170562 RepID=UPI000305898C|nr:hypothetical protein [Calothrix sp. PCC 6303]